MATAEIISHSSDNGTIPIFKFAIELLMNEIPEQGFFFVVPAESLKRRVKWQLPMEPFHTVPLGVQCSAGLSLPRYFSWVW